MLHDKDNHPIIIVKKIKRVAGGGHGGSSWKVAFADFATAMMAFFMLLWLISGTTKEEKQEIVKYFTHPEEFSIFNNPSSRMVILEPKLNSTESILIPSEVKSLRKEEIESIPEPKERQDSQKLKEKIQEAINKNSAINALKDQLLLDVTDEGLRIQIIDDINNSMFESGSWQLKVNAATILINLAPLLNALPNKISITGHTDADPIIGKQEFSNWELSTERANAARRALMFGGLDEKKVARVVGFGSTILFDKSDPLGPANRRISIVVLSKEAEKDMLQKAITSQYLIPVKTPVVVVPGGAPLPELPAEVKPVLPIPVAPKVPVPLGPKEVVPGASAPVGANGPLSPAQQFRLEEEKRLIRTRVFEKKEAIRLEKEQEKNAPPPAEKDMIPDPIHIAPPMIVPPIAEPGSIAPSAP